MILKCIIIDDEPIARKLLHEYIEETDYLTLVGTAENPLKATALLRDMEADLIFLDVNMPKMNGFQFLRSAVNLPMVIMTTAYGQYALDGFEHDVVDYLVKPFSLGRFIKATQKALELKTLKQKQPNDQSPADDHFFVKCEGKIEKVIFSDLVYFEAMANYVILYTAKRKLIVYHTMKGIQEKLPVGKFLQVHKSYIINIAEVNNIEGNMLDLGIAKISIGVSFTDTVLGKILKNKFIKR